MTSTTDNALLGGAITLRQPECGYRVTSDSVLLAALTPVRKKQRVLELGTGYGQVALCLLAREPSLSVMGLELLPDVAEMARANAELNGFANRFEVVCGDVAHSDLHSFDVVVANPPYREAHTHTASDNRIKAAATVEQVPLLRWTEAAVRALNPDGCFILIHDTRREKDVVAALEAAGFLSVQILPLIPKDGRESKRTVFCASKGEGSVVRLPGLVLHQSDGTWQREIECALRTPHPLEPWR